MRVREATNEFARDVMGAVIENRDDGASRIERDGQSWFRVAVTPKTIMTSLGPVTYRRARYRSGASGASPVPIDESLGLVDDYLTRPAAELGLLMMGRCTAREAAAFFAKTGAMTPSVSTLQRLTLSMHECWESLGPETLGSIREAEGIPQDATTASVSLDGVMVPLRPGEDGRADMARFRIRTNWTNSISVTHEFTLGDLADGATRDRLKWAMSDPERLRPGETRQTVTERAVAIAVRNASGRGRWSKLDEWLAHPTGGAESGIPAGAGAQQGSTLTGAMPYG